jgi:hypothetical protein
LAASELSDYVQFKACDVPKESGASRAYRGFIRPFSDDATARRVLRAIEGNRPITVFGGRLDADDTGLPDHAHEDFLVEMGIPFTVMVLTFSDGQRSRTYLLDPPIIPRLSACPHLRPDKSIVIGGTKVPALCVYSGAVFKFDDDKSAIEQVLDQTATYLAKYLVWLRTRNLYRRTPEGDKLVHKRVPGEHVGNAEILLRINSFWEGYWPGPSAPSGPLAHIETISPEDECWCWSGVSYGQCCRPREVAWVENFKRERIVQKLMAAAHARLEMTYSRRR